MGCQGAERYGRTEPDMLNQRKRGKRARRKLEITGGLRLDEDILSWECELIEAAFESSPTEVVPHTDENEVRREAR